MKLYKKDEPFNPWLIVILLLKISFSAFNIFRNLLKMFTVQEKYSYLDWLGILVAIIAIYGVYLLLEHERKGLYIFLATGIGLSLISFIQYCQITPPENIDVLGIATLGYEWEKEKALSVLQSNVGQVILVLLMMLLRKNKKNAYQVLWE